MSLSSKFKRLKVLGVIGFLAFSLLPIKVLADSSTFGTSFDNSLFQIVPAEQASVLRTDGCNADMGSGFIFSLIGAAQVPIGGSNLTNRLCAVQQAEKAGIVNVDKLKGDVNVLDTLGSVNNFILNQRPASTLDYVQDKVYALTGKVNAAEPAPYFAGGTGYQLLEPIQAFWGWSVNVVYAFLILIIIGIAFAIVFRQKIGGKEMVTIQNAIPSIAMAMILVPLSYAISGVFIDLIGIGANTVHAFFFAPGAPARGVYEGRDDNTCNNNLVVTNATGDTTGSGTTDDPCDRGLYIDDSRLEWYNFNSIIDVTDEVEGVANTEIAGQGVNSFFLTYLIKQFLDLLTGSNKTPAYWFGEIINAILLILMIWVSGRIAWRLLKKYLTLILTPIASPFIFASVAVPGNGMNAITNFAKSMGSASLHFIVTYALFLITLVFTSNVFADQLPAFSRGIFIPPILGLKSIFESLPVSGSESLTSFMFGVMGVGVFFSIPSILDNIDKSLGVKEANLGFIKAPIDALKDSAIGMRYTVPAAFAKTATTAGRVVTSPAGFTGRTLFKGLDVVDRMRGRDPAEARSFRSGWSRTLGKRVSQAEGYAQRAAQNDSAAGVALGNLAAGAYKTLGNITSGRTGGVPDQPSIKAVFKQSGGSVDNIIYLQPTLIRAIIDKFYGEIQQDPSSGEYSIVRKGLIGPLPIIKYSIPIGSLSIDAENGYKFYWPLQVNMFNGDTSKPGETDQSSPRLLEPYPNPVVANSTNEIKKSENVFILKVNENPTGTPEGFVVNAVSGSPLIDKRISENTIRLLADKITENSIKGGTNISIGFNLELEGDFDILHQLFGQKLDRNGLPYDSDTSWLSTGGNNIKTSSVGFKVGSLFTNSVTIRIKVPER